MLFSSHPRFFALAAALLSAAAAFAVGTSENTSVEPSARPQGGNGAQRAGELPADARLAADRSNWAEKLRRTPIEVESGSSLMGSKSWTPPPSEVKIAPTVPPFPFQYMGKIVLNGGETTLYLTKGDEIFAVKAGAVIAGTYRVEQIGADSIEITYLPLDKKQNVAFSSILPPAQSERSMIGMGSTPVTLAQATSPQAGNSASTSRTAEPSPSSAPAQPGGFAAAPVAASTGQAASSPLVSGGGHSTAETTTSSTGGMAILPPSNSQMPMLPPPAGAMPMIPPPAGATMPIIPPGGGTPAIPVPGR